MVRANRAKAIMLAGEISQVIDGALAESKIIGVADAGMTVDNVAGSANSPAGAYS